MDNVSRTLEDLRLMQNYPLELKIAKSKQRIKEWVYKFGVNNVYVSFSGGKDSTVLLHLVRSLFPSVLAVFVNTGLEYPQLQQFVKTFDNVTILTPSMPFYEVISKYGYPFISKEVAECVYQGKQALKSGIKYSYRLDKLLGIAKDKHGNRSIYNFEKWSPLLDLDFNISHMCCNVMKKKPIHKFNRVNNMFPFTGQLACESRLRSHQWVKNGCNGFDMKSPISNPLAFWTEQDILEYIKTFNIPIASIYGKVLYINKNNNLYENLLCEVPCKYCTSGVSRSGCIFCGFSAHLDKPLSRFQLLKISHPKQYDYCMNGGSYDNDGLWKPNQYGLGMRHCIEVLNSIYGSDFIKI